jgi:hypothetical protein
MNEQNRIDKLHSLIITYYSVKEVRYTTWGDSTEIKVPHEKLNEDEIKEIRALCMAFQQQMNTYLEGIKQRYEQAIYNFNKTPQP